MADKIMKYDLEVTCLIKSWNKLLVLSYNLLTIFENNVGYLIVLNYETVVVDFSNEFILLIFQS
jgi:hypothetical protein